MLGASAGCSAPFGEGTIDQGSGEAVDESGDVGSLQEGLGEPSCATGAATASFVGTIDYRSPTTYSAPGCFKAVKVDVENYSVPEGDNRTVVFWNAGIPTNQTACENVWIGSNLYERVGGAFEKLDFKSERGLWNPISARCDVPWVQWSIASGPTYRVTASARTAQTGGAATRSLGIATLPFAGGGGD